MNRVAWGILSASFPCCLRGWLCLMARLDRVCGAASFIVVLKRTVR